jgi:acetyltransferase EpsM
VGIDRVDIIGAGGHASVIAMVAQRLGVREIYLWADDRSTARSFPPNVRIGSMDDAPKDAAFFLGFGSLPERLTARARSAYAPPPLIDPSAIIAPDAEVGNGTVVFPGVIVNTGARIGRDSILNTGAIIEHDCVIGTNTHISPAACLSGGVMVGDNVHIGAGAVVIPRKTIGSQSIVGAGAVVISDVASGVTVVGVPAREVPSS